MAILLGTILSLVTYLHRTSHPFMRVMGFDSTEPARPFVVRADVPAPLPECPQLKMIRMEGEFYWGAVRHVADQLRELRTPPEIAGRRAGPPQARPDQGPRRGPFVALGGSLAVPGERGAPSWAKHLLVMAKSMNFIDVPA